MKTKFKTILPIILIIIIAGAIIMFLVSNGTTTESDKSHTSNETTEGNNTVNNGNNGNNSLSEDIPYEQYAEEQMAEPKEGDTIATIHVKNYGDITVKFFEGVAPKAVENFLTHAEEGYYNGVIFHRVINEFMIQGGDPEGTGRGGNSIWRKGFEEEISETLLPYRGSLCMASAGKGTSSLGSQFFITQAHYDEKMVPMLKETFGSSEKITELYKKYGGYMSLYKNYTIFGQVIEGMDVVDKIAEVNTDSNDKPLEDVVIESIDVKEYKKS